MGRHGLWGSGRASDPVNMYEEAVMTPMVWNWRGKVPVEGVRPEVINADDLFPSLCELAGITGARKASPGRPQLRVAGHQQAAPQECALAQSGLQQVRQYRDGSQRSLQSCGPGRRQGPR